MCYWLLCVKLDVQFEERQRQVTLNLGFCGVLQLIIIPERGGFITQFRTPSPYSKLKRKMACITDI